MAPPGPRAPKRLTHFLCIPLVTASSRPQLGRSIAAFREEVEGANGIGFPAGAVRPLGTLHLTLGVMSLQGREEVEEAVKVLRSIKMRDVLRDVRKCAADRSARGAELLGASAAAASSSVDGPLTVTLRGLQAMRKAAETSVLYAPPEDGEGILQGFCEAVRNQFVDAGIIVDEGRPLLLHATVLNTVYCGGGRGKNGSRGRGGRGGGGGGRLTIDARGLVDRYEGFTWIEDALIEGVAICKMGERKVEGSEDGAAYEVEAEVEI